MRTSDQGSSAGSHRRGRVLRGSLAGLVLVAALAAGVVGAVRYGVTYWLYRGYPAPTAPKTVTVTSAAPHHPPVVVVRRVLPATVQSFSIVAPSLGDWGDRVFVVLPPGYASHPTERYPVLYILHGSPGESSGFLSASDLLPKYEVLLARGQIRPMIIVIPDGAKSFFSDTEWANGIAAGTGWETFVAGTLVRTIDRRYRTIATPKGRGIAGLSEGGYGALNIGLHHLGEFSLMESWSGYEYADDITWIFGHNPATLVDNSPADEVRSLAQTLRARHDYLWLYIGTSDPLLHENQAFAAELTTLRVPHAFQVVSGRHSWALWRQMMDESLVVASEHLAHG